MLAGAGMRVEEECPPMLQDAMQVTASYWHHSHLTADEYDAVLVHWDRVRTAMLTFMEHRDAILCPVSDQVAVPHRTVDEQRFSYCLPYSLTGYPCAVVRGGTSAEGLPIGVQVVARPWHEDVALAIAQQLEDGLGGWQWPLL
jgi:amidase